MSLTAQTRVVRELSMIVVVLIIVVIVVMIIVVIALAMIVAAVAIAPRTPGGADGDRGQQEPREDSAKGHAHGDPGGEAIARSAGARAGETRGRRARSPQDATPTQSV